MKFIYLECKDCWNVVEVACDGHNAMYCPECHSVDNFKEIEED